MLQVSAAFGNCLKVQCHQMTAPVSVRATAWLLAALLRIKHPGSCAVYYLKNSIKHPGAHNCTMVWPPAAAHHQPSKGNTSPPTQNQKSPKSRHPPPHNSSVYCFNQRPPTYLVRHKEMYTADPAQVLLHQYTAAAGKRTTSTTGR